MSSTPVAREWWGSRSLAALALALALASRVGATDFLRGDVNGDGVVTLADLHRIEMYVYGGSPPPECLMAADFDDDDHVGYWDTLSLWLFLFADSAWPPPAPPYPERGPDPTEATLDPDSTAVTCEAHGGGSVLEDPATRVEVRDAIAAGGRDAVVVLTVALSSPRPSAALMGRLSVAGDIMHTNPWWQEIQAFVPDSFDYWGARITKNRLLEFDVRVNNLRNSKPYPSGEDQDMLEITLCLRPGARAGVYPITLEMAEVVEWGSGRSVRPSLAAGTITLLRDVVSTADRCSDMPGPSAEVDVEFRIGDAVTRPGGTFRVPFTIRSGAEFYGYGISIDFNEEVLESTGLELVWERPDGRPYAFVDYDINNRSIRPGNGEPDEGAVVGLFMLWTYLEPRAYFPADTENVLFALDFRVRPGVSGGTTTRIHVRHGAMGARPGYDELWVNHAVILGFENPYPTSLIAGRVEIVPEGSEHFVRGDSNGDDKVEVSDAVHTLEHLFLGGPAPRCSDAADANDSGQLDIADPINTLAFLFLGGPDPLPPPYPGLGKDATADALACGSPP